MDVLRQAGAGAGVPYDVPKLTRHSALVSRCAHTIARDAGADGHRLAEVTTAAMLHDIGKIVLADALGAEYTDVVRARFGSGRPIWQVEAEAFGGSHAAVGACLLGLWGLPDAVVAATAWHHDPRAGGDLEFTALTAVHAGNAVAHCLERDRNPERPVEPPDLAYLASLGLDNKMPRWLALCRDGSRHD
jgi:putative nucleotidyltransferase with HDIG domain